MSEPLTMTLPETCEKFRANVISTTDATLKSGIENHEFPWAIPLYTRTGEFKPLISRRGFEEWFKDFFKTTEVKGFL